MIKSFRLQFDPDSKNNMYPYAKEIEGLQQSFEFSPNINLVVGKNGSGKSTLIKYLTSYFQCGQRGYTNLTSTTLEKMFSPRDFSSTLYQTIQVQHDGQIVFYYSPDFFVGLYENSNEPDDDYFDQSLDSIYLKNERSHGQSNLDRIATFIKEIKSVEKKIHLGKTRRYNDYWQDRVQKVLKCLEPNIPQGPITLLIDEPERGLDFDHVMQLTEFIQSAGKEYQIIMVTHSFIIYHLLKNNANIIELSPGYGKKMDEILNVLK